MTDREPLNRDELRLLATHGRTGTFPGEWEQAIAEGTLTLLDELEAAEAQVAAVRRILDDNAGSDSPEHYDIRAALDTPADTPTEKPKPLRLEPVEHDYTDAPTADEADEREIAVQRAYAQIAAEKMLTVQPVPGHPDRAFVPPHWRAEAEERVAQLAPDEALRLAITDPGATTPREPNEHVVEQTVRAIRAAGWTHATPAPVQLVARRMERLRQSNPINGDCSNLMLDRALRLLVDEYPECQAAIEDERRTMQAEADEAHRRLERENEERRRREEGE